MPNNNPLISVITASYNSEAYIYQTYHSLKNQTYTNWEWNITDDGSLDSTPELLTELNSIDPRIKLDLRKVNEGPAKARNLSIARANGHFLAFLDADDLWEYTKLEAQLKFMEQIKCNISFTSYQIITADGRLLKKVDMNVPNNVRYEDLLAKKVTFGCSTVMINAAKLPNLSMPLIRSGQDYATWLSILRAGETAYLLKEVLTYYRITPNSVSRNKVKKALRQWQIYRKYEELSFFKSSYFFASYVYRAFFRK